MKIKNPSYVTRKFDLNFITLKFPSYLTREFKFKNSELRNSEILSIYLSIFYFYIKKEIPSNY